MISQALTSKKKTKKNECRYDFKGVLNEIIGVDLCQIEGINESSVLELIAEIGTDMTKWKNAKHFSAWLNLVPNTKISGGKVLTSKMTKKKNHAGQTLRMSASTLSRSKSALGDYHRKMRYRVGKKGAVVCTAHKTAKIIYSMIKEKVPYDKTIMEQNQDKTKEKKIRALERQLERLKKPT